MVLLLVFIQIRLLMTNEISGHTKALETEFSENISVYLRENN